MKIRSSARSYGILFLAVAIPLTVILTLPAHTSSAAPLLSENFNNNSFNSSIWQTFHQGRGPSVTVSNNRLEITIPSNSSNDPTIGGFGAGIGSLCFLKGDFDMQVSFQLLTWPSQNGVRVGIGPSVGGRGAGGTPFAAERDSFSIVESPPGENYLTHMLDGVSPPIRTSDLIGFLRLARTGSLATGYYMNNSRWIQVHTGPVVTSDVGFGFAAWSHDILFSHQTEKVAFGNFTLTAGTLQCPTIIVNPTTGPVGTTVTVQGSGFPAPQGFFVGASIEVTFDDQFLGTTTNNGGSFTFVFNVPFAQPGTHKVKAIDFVTQTNATSDFHVTSSPTPLSVALTVGAIYSPGDTAVANALVTLSGSPVGSSSLQLTATLTRPDNSKVPLTATQLGGGLFKISYSLPANASLGTYSLVVAAHLPGTGDGSALGSFEVKLPWLSSHATTLTGAGIGLVSLAGIVLVSWRKGYFRKSPNEFV